MSCHTCGDKATLVCRQCELFEFCSNKCSDARAELHHSLCHPIQEGVHDQLSAVEARERAAEFRKQASKMPPSDAFGEELMIAAEDIEENIASGARLVEAPSIGHVYHATYIGLSAAERRARRELRRENPKRTFTQLFTAKSVSVKEAQTVLDKLKQSIKEKKYTPREKRQRQRVVDLLTVRIARAEALKKKKVLLPKQYFDLTKKDTVAAGLISLEYNRDLFLPAIGEALELCAATYPDDDQLQELLEEHAEHMEGITTDDEAGAWSEMASNYVLEEVEGAPYRALLNVQLLTAKGRRHVMDKVIPNANRAKLEDIVAKASQMASRKRFIKNPGSPTYEDVIGAAQARLAQM